MVNKNIKTVLAVSFITVFSGCSTMTEKTLMEDVTAATKHAYPIKQVYVRENSSQTLVSGTVRKYKRRSAGHVHIEVTNKNGEKLSEEAMLKSRHKIRPKFVNFSANIPVPPEQVSKVEVTHHKRHY